MGAILSAIEKNPKEIKRLLGIDQDQGRQLIAQAELLHSQKQEEIERNKRRVNKKGGGKKPKLSPEEQILLTLVYLRHAPTFQLVKIFNVARERFRLADLNYKPVILALCGLVRLRIKAVILPG
jgi:hypothetical protein